jgi:DNA-binding response OmpR family regulator
MKDARILIVDDEPSVVRLYRKWLEADGHQVDEAGSIEAARQHFATSRYDVVLLDQRIPGSTESDAGLDLIGEATLTGGKVFIVTGHASEEAVERAFRQGVQDYVTKGPAQVMGVLLRHKVRLALEAGRSERAASRQPSERDGYIRSLWTHVRTEVHAQRKGRALEELLAEVFRTVPGFTVHMNEWSPDEEFDLAIENRATRWATESPFFLVEAKNWSSTVARTRTTRSSASCSVAAGARSLASSSPLAASPRA